MNILMVLTSHDELGNTGHKTGFWLEEFAAPYYVFKDAGAQVTLASPLGGQPPLDPKSMEAASQTTATRRFDADPVAQEALYAAGKPIAAVCHGPGALHHVKTHDGQPIVNGRNVTGFSNSEEQAAGLTEVVPFLVEDMLKKRGAIFSKAADWQAHVVVDGLLITGQNPASSEPAAQALLKALNTPAP